MQRVQSFYQQRARLYQCFFIDILQWEKVLEAFFRANPVLRPGTKILDAGCGTGPVTRVLYHLAREQKVEGITFAGFDLTPAMLALFEQWVDAVGAHGIQLKQADVLQLDTDLPEQWRGFDWIISSAMLEYIPVEQRETALRNLRRRINDTGRILLFVTKRTWLARWMGAQWWGTQLFDKHLLLNHLQRSGYSHIQFHRLPKGWDNFMLAVSAGTESDPGG